MFLEHDPSQYVSNVESQIQCDVDLADTGPAPAFFRCMHGLGTAVPLLSFFAALPIRFRNTHKPI